MTDTFASKDAWQRHQRDTILKPFFYDRYFRDRYRFHDSADPAQRPVDTTVETAKGTKTVEEKIVHWPPERDDPYDAFTLETMSCTVDGHERKGWMYTSVADILMYCFSVPDTEVGLDCYVMDMQALKTWFFGEDTARWPETRTAEFNRTLCRVVPISDVTANVKAKRYKVGPGWPDSHFCEVCCTDAMYGFDVRLLNGQRGHWFCKEHIPAKNKV